MGKHLLQLASKLVELPSLPEWRCRWRCFCFVCGYYQKIKGSYDEPVCLFWSQYVERLWWLSVRVVDKMYPMCICIKLMEEFPIFEWCKLDLFLQMKLNTTKADNS